jgi:hypothetical protein
MDDISAITREEVRKYAGSGRGMNVILFPVLDDERQTYTVTAVDFPIRKDDSMIVVLARIAGDQVVIEEDATDKPLVDALIQRGIPRDRIVLAYRGEPIPDAERFALPS